MIKNRSTLLKHSEFRDSIKILNEGIQAANPEVCLKPFFSKNRIKIKRSVINLNQFDNVYIIAIGKASDVMAKFVSKKVNFRHGLVVMPSNYKSVFSNKKFQFIKSGHPLPNKQSVKAAKYLESLLTNTKKNDFIIFLISGGGSALVSYPMGISLTQKIAVNKQLIHCGANINEISCVRKHLSEIKGGRLLQKMNCSGVSLVMSDVIGDDLSSISSGITYADNTTFLESIKILKKYKIYSKVPKDAINVLEMGRKKKFLETPKKPIIKNVIIGNNYRCLRAMKKKSECMDYNVGLIHNINTDVKIAAKQIVKTLENTKKTCLIFGGETTVRVTGNGKGGRNQELVLRLLKELKKYNNFIISSIATDGIDGNTQFAGAIISSGCGLPFEHYLKNNDSFNFYKKFGGLVKTGPTHTNMNDIGIIIRQNQ